jgi:tetratricopeptide (TPR) repeat protein
MSERKIKLLFFLIFSAIATVIYFSNSKYDIVELEKMYDKSYELYKQGKYQEAIKIADKIIEKDKNFQDAYMLKARCYYEIYKDFLDKAKLAQQSEKRKSANKKSHKEINQDEIEKTKTELFNLIVYNIRKAISIRENEKIYTESGVILYNIGATEEGKELIKKAVKINPYYKEAREILTKIKIHELQEELAQRQKLELYKKMLSKHFLEKYYDAEYDDYDEKEEYEYDEFYGKYIFDDDEDDEDEEKEQEYFW